MGVSLIPSNEVLVHSYDEAAQLAKILMDNNYVVMLSMENGNYIVNWTWSENGEEPDRNDVVFMDRSDFADIIYDGEARDKFFEEYC
jgi:hypothetical protein